MRSALKHVTARGQKGKHRSACSPAAGCCASRLSILSAAPRDVREDFQAVDRALVPPVSASDLRRANGGCCLGPNDVRKTQQERLVVVAGALQGGRGQAQLPNLVVSSRPGLGVQF